MEGQVQPQPSKEYMKLIDDKYAIKIQKLINDYPLFFESQEYEAYLKDDPKVLLTCIIVSKQRMSEIVKKNLYESKKLPCNEPQKLNRLMVSKLKELVQFANSLDHENILKVVDFTETRSNVYIILERYKSLSSYILQRYPIQERKIIVMIQGLISAVSYISNKGIISGRLDHEYVVEHQSKLKMNFLAFIRHQGLQDLCFDCTDTTLGIYGPKLFAPEALTRSQYFGTTDIWGLGAIIYLMLSKKMVFEHLREVYNHKKYQNKIPQAIENIDEMFRPLVSRMLVFQQDKRADISEVVRLFSALLEQANKQKEQQLNSYEKQGKT